MQGYLNDFYSYICEDFAQYYVFISFRMNRIRIIYSSILISYKFDWECGIYWYSVMEYVKTTTVYPSTRFWYFHQTNSYITVTLIWFKRRNSVSKFFLFSNKKTICLNTFNSTSIDICLRKNHFADYFVSLFICSHSHLRSLISTNI